MSDLSGVKTPELAWFLADALERVSHAANAQRKAEEEAGAIRAELAKRLIPGEVIEVDESTYVLMEPAKPNGRRSVNKDGIHAHIEALGPMGLGPVEEVKLTYRYPTVAELERRSHVLEAYGVPIEDLVSVPPMGEPEIVVKSVPHTDAPVPGAKTGSSHDPAAGAVSHRGGA